MLAEPFGVAAAARGHGDADALAFLCFLPDGMLHRLINVYKPRNFAVRRLLPAGNAGAEHLIEPVYRILHAVRAAHDADAGIRLIRGVHAGGRHAAQDSHARRPGQRLFPPSAALRRNPNLLSDRSVLCVYKVNRAVLRERGGLSRSNIHNYRTHCSASLRMVCR